MFLFDKSLFLESKVASKLPPPCPQFMSRSERDAFLKKRQVVSDQPGVVNPDHSDQTKGQCLLQKENMKSCQVTNTEHGSQQGLEKWVFSKKNSNSKKPIFTWKLAFLTPVPKKSRKRTRSSSSDKRKKPKKNDEKSDEIIDVFIQAEKAEPLPKLEKSDEKSRKRVRKDSEADEKCKKAENVPKRAKVEKNSEKSLFRRARTCSYPPLQGCTQYHGWQFWSSMTPVEPTKVDKSSQTEFRERNWSDAEKKIDQLIKQGRNEAKKRKIQSKIQFPVNSKKRRKSRLRKRKKRRPSVISKRWDYCYLLPHCT